MSSEPVVIPHTPPTLGSFVRNTRDLPESLSLSGMTAGFIMVLINYTGPLLIVLQAVSAANISTEQSASWIWAVIVGNGVATIVMSLLYRQPLTSPYNTAGAALLVTSIGHYRFSDAVGAFIVCALMVAALGLTGWFGRLMRLIPQPVVMAVLAGVLLRFGLGIFNALDDAPANPVIILPMIASFFLMKRIGFRAPSLIAMAVGIGCAFLLGLVQFGDITLTPTLPVITWPTFSLNAVLTLSLPLFALALSSQYAPGQAVLTANNFDAPINGILSITGGISTILALFGGHGNVLGALTAAIVVSPDAQPDPSKRYASAVASGAWHIAFGVFGTTVLGVFSALPSVFVSTIAGLSLASIIASSLGGAMNRPEHRDAAVVAFLCTAGDFSVLGIGAPFWGLVAGVAVHTLMSAASSIRLPPR